MTKEELVNILNKYDDECAITFYDQDKDSYLTILSVEQYIDDASLTINVTK